MTDPTTDADLLPTHRWHIETVRRVRCDCGFTCTGHGYDAELASLCARTHNAHCPRQPDHNKAVVYLAELLKGDVS